MMLEDEFEVGSVFNAGSKKQNISHLLNFQFEPRGSQASNGAGKKTSANSKQKFFTKSSGKKTHLSIENEVIFERKSVPRLCV